MSLAFEPQAKVTVCQNNTLQQQTVIINAKLGLSKCGKWEIIKRAERE